WASVPPIWLTWWLGDLTGAIVIAPVLVLWAAGADARSALRESLGVFAAAAGVGLIAFGPMMDATVNRGLLAFLGIVPLLWAALRCGQRDTATAALILSAFAVWGTVLGGGPFARQNLNDSFLLLLMFMISTCAPSLVLSADAAERKRTEDGLRRA